MEVVVVKVTRKEGSAVIAGVVRPGIGPLAGDGLDEALGLPIGLRAVGAGEEVAQPKLLTGGGKKFGAISRAAVGEQALDVNAVSGVEVDGLLESGQDAGCFFVREERGKGEAGVIVDGDVETLDAGAWVAHGALAGGADAGACEAAQLLDVEVEEFAGMVAFVAHGGRFGGLQGSEAVEAVPMQDAGERGLGNRKDHEDLSIGPALAAQSNDSSFESGAGLVGLAMGSGGMIMEALREAKLPGPAEPAAHRLFADAVSGGGGAPGKTESSESGDHLGSRQRGESGISVHVVRAVWRGVEC